MAVDALLHEGEADAIATRGGQSFAVTFTRVLLSEVAKANAKGGGE